MNNKDIHDILLLVLVALACPLCLPLVIKDDNASAQTDKNHVAPTVQ